MQDNLPNVFCLDARNGLPFFAVRRCSGRARTPNGVSLRARCRCSERRAPSACATRARRCVAKRPVAIATRRQRGHSRARRVRRPDVTAPRASRSRTRPHFSLNGGDERFFEGRAFQRWKRLRAFHRLAGDGRASLAVPLTRSTHFPDRIINFIVNGLFSLYFFGFNDSATHASALLPIRRNGWEKCSFE